MNYAISEQLQELQARTRAFIAQEVISMERDPRCTPHGPNEELRAELIAKARKAGLLSSHVSHEFGGLGLNHAAKAVLFEEAGYSPLGPVALNIAAPDEGNMHLLEMVATPAQKERWLRPLAAGTVRSCFCMTEPAPGAGANPSMLLTRAVKDGDDYQRRRSVRFPFQTRSTKSGATLASLRDLKAVESPSVRTCISAIASREMLRKRLGKW
jgi:acyl-CoA dehydrogenase